MDAVEGLGTWNAGGHLEGRFCNLGEKEREWGNWARELSWEGSDTDSMEGWEWVGEKGAS